MNLLVMGGSGFIGSHLVELLLTDSHDVTVFHQVGANLNNLSEALDRIKVIEGDFHNQSDVMNALNGVDVVVHLISATLPGNSLSNPAYDAQMNIVSSVSLFEQCVKSKVKKLVFISSGGTVYGIPSSPTIHESHPQNPISPYGVSKLAIEKYLGMFNYQYGLDYVVLRLSNPYGPRQDAHRGQGVIAAWMDKIIDGESIEIWGDGSVIRDYIYIEDAVNAIRNAVDRNLPAITLNVGSGVGYSLSDLHSKIEFVLGKKVDVKYKDVQKIDVPVNILDISLSSKWLDWTPKINIEDGLKKYWEYRNNR